MKTLEAEQATGPHPSMFKLAFGAFALAALALSGCQTTGYEQAAKGSATAVDVSQQVAMAEASLDNAVEALDAFMERPVLNPQQQLRRFQSGVQTATASWDEISDYVEDLDENMEAYLTNWGAESVRLGSSEMRHTAAERREEVQEVLNSFESEYVTASTMVDPALNRMQDLVMMLENDLTEDGIRAAEEAILDTREVVGEMRTQLENLRVHATRVAEYLSPATEPVAVRE